MRNIFSPSQTMTMIQSLFDNCLKPSVRIRGETSSRDRMDWNKAVPLFVDAERANFILYLCRLKCSLKFINYFLQRIPLKSVNKSVP